MTKFMIRKIILILIFAIFFTPYFENNTSVKAATGNDTVQVNLTVNANTSSGGVPTPGAVLPIPPPQQETFIPPVDNPNNSRAIAGTGGIYLYWSNPKSLNFSYVRIMRHEDRFHSDPFVGKLVYEGREEAFFDKGVVLDKEYFYVLFSRDNRGNLSSGSAVSVRTLPSVKIPPVPPADAKDDKIINEEIVDEKEVESVVKAPTYLVRQPKQKVQLLSQKNPVIITTDKNITIDTDKTADQGDYLKVTGPKGETLGKYLFSFNQNSDRYEAVIPPLKNKGEYKVTIYRYDGNTPEVLSRGVLYVSGQTPQIEEKGDICNSFSCKVIPYIKYIIASTISLLILLILLILKKKYLKNKNVDN